MLLRAFTLCFICCVSLWSSAQQRTTTTYEKAPVFPNCKKIPVDSLVSCFRYELNSYIFSNFEVPEVVLQESYQGAVEVLFEVDREGEFKTVFVDAIYEDLKTETNRLFESIPPITPATYNGTPTFAQYTIKIKIPLVSPEEEVALAHQQKEEHDADAARFSNEIDSDPLVSGPTKPISPDTSP